MHDILTIMRSAREMIEKRGFAVLPSSTLSEEGQICAYTLGMVSQGLPDLVIFMADHAGDLPQTLLTEVANIQIRQGKFAHGRVLRSEMFTEGEHHASLQLLEVKPIYLKEIFILNKALFPNQDFEQEAFQVVYPDDNGKYTWEPGSEVATMRMVSRLPE